MYNMLYRVQAKYKNSKLPLGHFEIDNSFTTKLQALYFISTLDKDKYYIFVNFTI